MVISNDLEHRQSVPCTCRSCGAGAATAEIRRGDLLPFGGDAPPFAGYAKSPWTSSGYSFFVNDLLGRIGGPCDSQSLSELRTAMASGEPRQLYDIDYEFARFYCPTCDAAYCRQHWTIETVFDEDYPGWYDCTYGTCDEGHRRKLDD